MGEAVVVVVVAVTAVGISGEFGRETINLQSPTHKSAMKEGFLVKIAKIFSAEKKSPKSHEAQKSH